MRADPRGMSVGPSGVNVEEAAALLADDPAAARLRALDILQDAPDDPRALLILASAHRRLGVAMAAYPILARLAAAFPKATKTHYELGLALADLGRSREAIAALRHTLFLDPGLADAWRVLGEQLYFQGETQAADAAFAEHSCASVNRQPLKSAARALSGGDPTKAETLLRAFLLENPNNTDAMRLMGETLLRLRRYADAETVLGHCLSLNSNFDGVRFSYAEALFHQQKAAAAIYQAKRLIDRRPNDPAYLNLLAACLGLVGDDDQVQSIYKRLLTAFPAQPHLWLNQGHALRTIGKKDEAAAAYRTCIKLAPQMGEAYWSLANLKVEAFSVKEVAAMEAQINGPTLCTDDRLHLHYALGKALEDQGEFEESFQHYEQAARLRRKSLPYDSDANASFTQRSKVLYTAEFFAKRPGAGDKSRSPVFIVGLPRSGSTLVEQILASHPRVEGTRELSDIGLIAQTLGWLSAAAAPTYPNSVGAVSKEKLSTLGLSYLRSTQMHRKLGRPMFLDKMPNNFQHIGLIHLILPNAKIIDVRRNPMGACFSAFKQHFAQGQSFTYDLNDLGRYYRAYIELMDHWDEVLPGRVHRVVYEDLVEDTETQVRKLLDYCGLDFDDACLRFYKNARAVRTVSSEQVRQPIFRQSVDQWRNYEPWLEPLKSALGPAIQDWRKHS